MIKPQSQALKVAYITTSLGMGGAEEILAKLSSGLTDIGDEIVVFSLSGDGYHGDRLRSYGIKVCSIDAKGSSRASFLAWPVELIKLFVAIKRLRPDLIHSWMYPADIISGIIGVTLRVPVIWGIFSGSTNRRFYSRRTYRFIKACARLSHYLPALIISCSAYGRKTHIGAGYREAGFLYIPTGFKKGSEKGISTINYKNSVIRHETDDNLVVGMLGRYTVEKDHLALVRAVSSINRNSEEVQLIFAGGEGITNNNPELAHEIERYGMTSSTSLLGQIPDKKEFFQAIDIFALISHSEGFPTVIGEAMSYGLPCIVSDVGDAKVLVGDQSQIIDMKSANVTGDIAKRILHLGSSTKLRQEIGLRNTRRIEELFSEDLMVSRYRKAYKSIAKKKV